jgi:hypothetical protein
MNKGLASWFVLLGSFTFAVNSPSLQAAEYGQIPGKWTLNKQGFRDKFVPNPGYGKGVYAVRGISADEVLALDTDGKGFAECRKISGGTDTAQPIPEPNCSPAGPRCTAFPYKCSSELSKPLFIETNIRPTASERLIWANSASPAPAFKPIINPAQGIRPFYFERSCRPKLLDGKTLLHGAWLTGPNKFQPEADESYPTSVYDHFGRALYIREASGIKFLSGPSLDFGEASAFEPAITDKYQWEGEPASAMHHDQPQYYPFHKMYTVPGGYWLEIDWLADFEGAGAVTHTLILQIIDGKVSEFTSAQQTRMY